MKYVVWIILVSSILSTAVADMIAGEIIDVSDGELAMAMVLLSGALWVVALCVGGDWTAFAALCNAIGHVLIWFLLSHLDRRTFFGGAMMRIISAWGWVFVTVLLIITLTIRSAVRSARRRAR